LMGQVGAARAAPEALVEAYLRESGLLDQVVNAVGPGVLKGIDRSEAQVRQLNDAQLGKLREAVRVVYGAAWLGNAMKAQLASSLPGPETEQALAWFTTSLGKRVVRLEAEASRAEPREQDAGRAAKALADLSPERARQLQRSIKASRAVDITTIVTLNQRLAMIHGIARASGATKLASASDAKAKLDVYRVQIAGAAESAVLADCALIYAGLSDDELGEYAAFLETPGMLRVTTGTIAALDKVLTDAAAELGRRSDPGAKPSRR